MLRTATSCLALGLAFLAIIGWADLGRATPLGKIVPLLNVAGQRDGIVAKLCVSEGEMVDKGALLAQLDDRLAIADRDIKAARVDLCKAEYEAAQKTQDEAKKRYETAMRLRRANAVSAEELGAASLTVDRYTSEAISKKEAINVAALELKQAELVLELHQIRSPIAGEVKGILKQPGEAVKNLETVIQIRRTDK